MSEVPAVTETAAAPVLGFVAVTAAAALAVALAVRHFGERLPLPPWAYEWITDDQDDDDDHDDDDDDQGDTEPRGWAG